MSRTAGIGPGARRYPIHLGAGVVERGPPAPHAGGRPASVAAGEALADACAEIRNAPAGRRTGRDAA